MADGRKPMTKSQIVSHLAERLGIPKKAVSQFFDEVALLAAKETNEAGAFTFPSVGKVSKRFRKARKGRNPATGEEIDIPAKTVVKIRLSKGFQELVIPPKK